MSNVDSDSAVVVLIIFSATRHLVRPTRPPTTTASIALQLYMASHLANIFGTEQGPCQLFDSTTRLVLADMAIDAHESTSDRLSPRQSCYPTFITTLPMIPSANLQTKSLQEGFDAVYEDLYCELSKFGHLLELHVCDNVGDHLIGNVYARYEWETEAQAAVDNLNDRWEACCRQNENGECNRGGFCNFMHLRLASKELVSSLRAGQRIERRLNPSKIEGGGGGWEPGKREGGKGRSASPSRRGGASGEDRWTRK
ncbi:hypothetical protein BU15DRAFT_60813 [Melanogaster broomeanus]|nr:hypothetical protein BU15DRAFT_60813 [Melanogaster broomeanus]